jgi:DNA-binding response OmpR family regulator
MGQTRGSILIVEDDLDTREAMADALRRAEYAVAEAQDGQAALDVLGRGEFQPSLILLDLMMPRMDGATFLAHWSRPEHVRIVVFTAAGSSADQVPPSVDFVLSKPVALGELLETVRSFVPAPL